jgi:Fic family protein
MVQFTNPRTGEPSTMNFVEPENVHSELHSLLSWCSKNEGKCDMLDFLTVFHYNLCRIHPFEDMNGRITRIVMWLFQLRNNYPPVAIDPEDRPDYMVALSLADLEHDLKPLARFLGYCMMKSYSRYAEAFGSQK